MIRLKTLLTEQAVNQDQLDTLQVTTSDDGVRGMIKQGICTYTDDSGKPVTIDLTAVPGARGISQVGNINVDVNSTLFKYLADYWLTLTKEPDHYWVGIDDATTIEKLINNTNDKLIQFENPAADYGTILFIRTKTGKVEMFYLNVYTRSRKK